MNLSALAAFLKGVDIPYYEQTFSVSLNLIGKLIRSLIEGVGIVGIGIILFSVILKAIVLPFDIYQRVNMTKQNTKMKENKDKLEKLQKQYANDKEMYNKKMMEMYKANGISMFSSCLPAILSIVIFFIAINAFNAYSNYANLQNYNTLVRAYNVSVENYIADEEHLTTEYRADEKLVYVYDTNASTTGNYVFYTFSYNPSEETLAKPDYNEEEDIKETSKKATKQYYIMQDLLYNSNETIKAEIDSIIEKNETTATDEEKLSAACRDYMKSMGQKEVLNIYNIGNDKIDSVKNATSFIWIKNIWQTDASFKHPVLSWKDFKNSLSNAKVWYNGKNIKFSKVTGDAYNSIAYENITAELSTQKSQANGYYILIVLSIGTILLQQWISMRTQKEQQQFSSVDGQGGFNQKSMMIIMTLMFAVFAFMYSSAFSIYMITSNILSLIITVLINKIVKTSMEKKEQKEIQEKYNQRFRAKNYKNENNSKKTK